MAKSPASAERNARPSSPAVTMREGEGGETHQQVPEKGDHRAGEAHLTTNHGMRISDNQNSLKAGTRGPSLLEEFVLREKMPGAAVLPFAAADRTGPHGIGAGLRTPEGGAAPCS